MEYRRLGRSGLQVSRVVLGCMGFGDPPSGWQGWTIGLEEARPIVRQALEAGITTFDTANVYSHGSSEEIVGLLLGELARRDEVVIATKVWGRMGPGPTGGGLSRGAILTQVDESLRRLKTDYIDLYQIHRYDPETPIEETLAALHDLVRAGKVRYLGASSMPTWRFVQAQYLADLHGWTRFASMQDQYNLLMREEEREMLPFCIDQGVGVLPWSPLARGYLTRDWGDDHGPQPERSVRPEDVSPGRGVRPPYRRRGRRDRRRTWRLAGAGRPRLAPASARGHRADRGCDSDRAPHRRPRGRRAAPRSRRARAPRGRLRAPRPGGLLIGRGYLTVKPRHGVVAARRVAVLVIVPRRR